MFRSHPQLLTALCVVFAIVYFLPITSRTQGSQHSLSLNGTNSYVSIPNSASINISGPITIEAWIKVNAITGNYQEIVYRHSWQVPGTGGGYEFSINNTGKLRLDLYQSHNLYTTAIGSTTITTGTWHHVAGVWDGNQTRLYLNGVLDGSLWTTNGPASGNSPLKIGLNTGGSYYFGGLIDEVRISAAALYSSNFSPGLGLANNTRAWWKFDGQTANDFSGNGNHGTLQGGATYSTNVPATSNNAPSVTITDPLNNTSFSADANILIDATAADNDGAVDRVDFYQGATLIGTDTVAPYTFGWGSVPAGVYSLTAKATDDDGASTSSTSIAVTVLDSSGSHSLSLNGTNSYVSIPNSASINISGPITIEAWIKVNAITGNYQEIVYRHSWQVPGTGGGYEFSINNTGKLRLDLYQSHNLYTTAIGSTTITTGTWHHVAGVWDGNQTRLYLNGVLDGSLWTTNGPASGNSPLKIGLNTGGSYYFGGLIDEVRISAAALYSSNFSPGLGPANNTRAWWKFDGQTANDFSGNGNHGTLQGGATYSTNVPPPAGGTQRPVPISGGPYNSQLAQLVQFSSSGSFDPDGTITAYHWNFGDGTSSNTANPTHTYAAPGLYTATLTLTDNTGLLASATAPVTISSNGNARLDALNQTGGSGENALSRNFNWNLPLVGLPGRAGMDLSLSLSYNSLVWTKNGNYISFDDDRGFPAPGFRLGFPVIQTRYYNTEVGKYAFLLIGTDGARTELRQVDSSLLYESADSSHLLLESSTMVLQTADGTQLSYVLMGNEYNCTQIKDRNGNYITVNYTPFGRIDTVVDTLARSIKFNYDANGRPTSITQVWNQGSPNQVTHNWATFTYADVTIQTNFSGLTVSGPSNNSSIKMLSRVTLANGSHSDFSYTSWGQVWKVSNYAADDHLLNHRSYNLPQTAATAQTDCPRFTERREWAQYWNGDTDGTAAGNEEASTLFIAPVSETWTMPDNTQASGVRAQVTTPDGTTNKIYFIGTAGTSSGWRRGLPALVVTESGGTWQRKVMTTWTQDNPAISYPLNPSVTETNVYDPEGNRARTEITYQQFTYTNGTSCRFPRNVHEYAADATTKLRTTQTDYHSSTSYSNRRILGLVSEKRLYEGDVNGALMSKVGYFYDNENGASSIQGTDAPVQHDNLNYSASFVTGRANLSSIRRYDVTNTSQFTTTRSKFNTAGAVVSSKDALDHEVTISYADSFSDGNNSRNTLAYATTVTDADGFSSTTKYNFDFGAVTRRQTPMPNVTTNTPGPEQSFTFDSLGRVQQINSLVNNAYTRFEYPTSQTRVDVYTTIQEGQGEAHSLKITDGHGRVVATATDHPGSVGGFSGQKFVYDVMGRVIKTSNPAETNASGAPSQWTTAGDDAAAGWIYTQQTYDWKGRPRVTTNQDGTTNSATYTGCGCAGGEVVTLTDEVGRQQKVYSDVLGRAWKTEILDGNSDVYSAWSRIYNARDQVTAANSYRGGATSDLSCPTGACMQSLSTYDGYGRLATHKLPQQTTAATYVYNADDTVQSVTDPRGVVTTNSFNSRHLLTGVAYTPAGSVPALASASFGYDAAGNRKSMSDGSGTASYVYDQLSRMTSETKTFSGLTGSYTINYGYNISGLLTSVIDTSGAQVSYGYDSTGRLGSMPASGYDGVTNFLSSTQYRAAGAMKRATYGNGVLLELNYNSRMQIGQYQVSNANFTAGATMGYYADGRTNTAFDLNDSRFDRKYEFDSSARLKEAYTGVEAHGAPAPPLGQANSPYRQTYSYDEWNNVTLRTGRIWAAQTEHDAVSYSSDNKRANTTYDAAGNITWANEGGRTYDAAGRPVTFTSSQHWQVYPNWPSGNPDGPALETQDTFDSTGRVVKHVNRTRRDDTLDSGGGNLVYNMSDTTTTTYYLHSSVLGKTIAHLDQSGNKTLGYVYAGAMRVATQTVSGSSNSVLLESTNPVTGAAVLMDTSGNYLGREEPDPLGRDLTSPPDALLVIDPLFSAKLNEPMPLEYAAHWTGELESGMAQHLDTMDMVRAREAYTRWLGSERTSNPDRRIWEEVLNRNPNVGIVKGEETLWGRDAADFLSKNSDRIIMGANGILFRPQKPAKKGDINVDITWKKCEKGSSLLTINGNSIRRTENGGASIKLDGPAAFFFGLVASDQAGRDVSLKANTVLSLNVTDNNGYAISSNPSVSIGFFGPNVSVRSVQFNANGAVTGVDARYLGFEQPISNLVKQQLNSAMTATFGPGSGVTSDVVQSLLNTARDNPTGVCINANISPVKKP